MNKYLIALVCLFFSFSTSIIAQSKESDIQGIIVSNETQEPLCFATVMIKELEKGTVCDIDGRFTFSNIINERITLDIRCLGYAASTVIVDTRKSPFKIALEPLSIKLDNVVVSASYNAQNGSDANISQEALEYIQPTSLQDIFLLLPGEISISSNMQQRKYTSSRQSGSDQSTSFGIGVSMDGIPTSNDGNRIQMGGFTGQSSLDPNNNVSINSGIDMRTISTDHIESVTIKKGIASAKEGNMSSGLIQINSKKGVSPLRIRAKIDPLNKLAYIGKGFMVSDAIGSLHLGADITQSASDIRDLRSAYNRVTGQITHTNTFPLGTKTLDFNQRLSYITSFNNSKNDELYKKYGEEYKTKYSRYTYALKTTANLEYKVIDKIEFSTALDYSIDILDHTKYVNNPSVLIIQPVMKPGEHEGTYLPSRYTTFYSVENKPFNLFTTLNAVKTGSFSEAANYTIDIGNSISMTKNHGAGAKIDPYKPPYPTNDFIRSRPNYAIPAIAHNASYIDTKLRYSLENNDLNLALGLRGTKMLNLPNHYKLASKYMLEPRTQLSYTNRVNIASHTLSNTFRVGYGIENKLPSMDYLYPDDIYQDFIVLNAYFNDPAKRLLLTKTVVHEAVNPDIIENKNQKIELGWDTKYKGVNLSLTFFQEQMNNGIEYFQQYQPISYTYYNELKYPVDHKPSKDDFNSYLHKDYSKLSTPVNSAKTVKRGIEYRLSIDKIETIKSSIEINGAYYKTLYTSGIPVMFRPSITENNKPYEYVGIYDGFDKNYSSRFNTNIWVHTFLPKYKLIFTNFLQMVWFQSSRLGDDISLYPSKYIDYEGNTHSITAEQIDNNPKFSSLKRDLNKALFNEQCIPFAMNMNTKVTKEVGKYINLSFFVNNLIQINKEYKTPTQQTQKIWLSPFFGTELTFKF